MPISDNTAINASRDFVNKHCWKHHRDNSLIKVLQHFTEENSMEDFAQSMPTVLNPITNFTHTQLTANINQTYNMMI